MKNSRSAAYTKGNLKKIFLLSAGGLIAGFCNGLLGAGGGIVLVLFLSRLMQNDEESRRSIYANALCVMLPLSVLTLWQYTDRGSAAEIEITAEFVLGAIAGGLIGGSLLGKLRGKAADRLFAVLTLISGILMISR